MHKENWDDLRFVLAVAQNGSVSAAARELGVNHATVLRRIATFEDRHGSPIFDKTPRGYSIPPDKARVIDAAREVETAMLAVDRMIEGAQAPLSGRVRVTSTDTFCNVVLPPILSALRARAADLQIDVICSNAHLDLARLDADITVRPAATLPDQLHGEPVARLGFGVYSAPTGAKRWLGLGGALAGSVPALWLSGAVPTEAIIGSADSFLTLREMAANGLGRAILPRVLGESDARLTAVPDILPPMDAQIWVACHTDLANVPRILAVRQYLVQALQEKSGVLLSGV